MSEDQKKQLEQQLWNIANTLRGKMDADEFRDYILGFIFYKYLSEKMYLYANKILKEDGLKYEDIKEDTKDGDDYLTAIKEEALIKLGYFLKPSELFSEIAKRGNADADDEEADVKSNFILEDLAKILNSIEQSTMGTDSEDEFDNLFEDLDLTSTKLGRTESAKNALIAKVLAHLNKIDFKLEDVNSDVLGDAYEYLIGKFASGAGKKAGEFYTPQEVSKVLAKLVTTGKSKLKTVYDPTCGSGSLLLRVAKEVTEVGKFYGQELNRTTYNLARMNMILHDVHYRRFDIRQEDTLEQPQHINERFEAIVANPPFSAEWSANQIHMSDDRFSQYGRLAPKSTADFAFVQHMIHHLADNGIMAMVVAHGVLYRGGAEGHIRQYLIEDRNYLDAVIGLPVNLFYGTSIPTAILVFKKCREQPNDILFIDASKEFEKSGNQNYLRDENIDHIITTYRKREAQEKYSHVATLQEIKENDYNLNITRYVNTFEDEEIIDLTTTTNELKIVENEIEKIDATIADFCKELGIKMPFSKGIVSKIFNQELRFKDNSGSDYPEWEEKKLGEIFTFFSTNSFPRNLLNYENGKVRNIHYGDIHTKYKTNFDITKEIVPFLNDSIDVSKIPEENYCKQGDLIIADASEDYKDIGKAIELINLDNQKVVAGLHTYIARDLNKLTYLGFKGYMMQGYGVRLQMMKMATGSSVLGITKGNLSKIKIKLPSLNEQKKITDFLSAIDIKINLVTKQMEGTQSFKKGLLQQIFV